MGYGLPESYGLSPLSQLRTGQKVWGIGSYGLSEGMGYGEFDCTTLLEELGLPVIVFDRPHWSAHTTLPAQAPVPHHYRPNRSAKVSQGSYYFCTQGFASGMLRNGAEGYQKNGMTSSVHTTVLQILRHGGDISRSATGMYDAL